MKFARIFRMILVSWLLFGLVVPLPRVVEALAANSATSRNWSGYSATGGKFTSISATWVVPELQTANDFGVDATWIGIGGVESRDLIQGGTQVMADADGNRLAEAFVETLPKTSERLPLEVNPGDRLSVSLSLGENQEWHFDFHNLTTSESYHTTRTYDSSLSSADWVEETPLLGRFILPVSDFGAVTFEQAAVVKDGQALSIKDSGATAISMGNGRGDLLAVPTSIDSFGSGFTVNRTDTKSVSATVLYPEHYFHHRF